ncbi:non-canonical purine NTP pyrophosphatase [Agathobacter sp.]
MRILLGTTNPSKVKRFSDLLKGCDAEFITLNDLVITDEPEENGTTPEENAILKAKFYGKYFDIVICNDSGLYFEELALDDVRQPGLNVRTPMGMDRLSDEEMIDYYSKLIGELGGKVSAYYLDGIAVYNHGNIYSFMDADMAQNTGSFYMIETPSPKRFEGWPLDSLSINKETGKYFVDGSIDESKENIIKDQYEKSIVDFLKKSLHIG